MRSLTKRMSLRRLVAAAVLLALPMAAFAAQAAGCCPLCIAGCCPFC